MSFFCPEVMGYQLCGNSFTGLNPVASNLLSCMYFHNKYLCGNQNPSNSLRVIPFFVMPLPALSRDAIFPFT